LNDNANGNENDRVYSLSQDKLKLIKSYPFIYWISDEFREKFIKDTIGKIAHVAEGCKTANNFKFLRFWWEINHRTDDEKKQWPSYAKGGSFRKWQGNLAHRNFLGTKQKDS